jgi:hypothetical protein
MFSRFLFTAFISLLAWPAFETPVAAQSSSNQQPAPPYLAPVPDRLHWIVTFSYVSKNDSGTAPASSPSENPASIETMKVGNMRRILVKFAEGSPQQLDIIGNHCFVQGPLGLEYRTMDADFVPYMFFTLGFSFTQCVNLASFKEFTTYQNARALHYRDGSTEAWISADTKLPLGADQIGSVKTTYQYLPVPDAISLTPQEQKILQNQKQAEAIYNNMR